MHKQAIFALIASLGLSGCCLITDEACRAEAFEEPEPVVLPGKQFNQPKATAPMVHYDAKTRMRMLTQGGAPVFTPIEPKVAAQQSMPAGRYDLSAMFPEISHLLGGPAAPKESTVSVPEVVLKPNSVAKAPKVAPRAPSNTPKTVKSKAVATVAVPATKTMPEVKKAPAPAAAAPKVQPKKVVLVPEKQFSAAAPVPIKKAVPQQVPKKTAPAPTAFYTPVNQVKTSAAPVKIKPMPKAKIVVEKGPRATSGAAIKVQAPALPASETAELLDMAQHAMHARQYAVAEGVYATLLHHTPNHKEALLGAAIAKHQQHKLDEAAFLYRNVISLEEQHPIARRNLLEIGLQKDPKGTVQLLRAQVANHTVDEFGYYALGRYFLQQQHPSLAAQYLAGAYAKNPNEPLYSELLSKLTRSAMGQVE